MPPGAIIASATRVARHLVALRSRSAPPHILHPEHHLLIGIPLPLYRREHSTIPSPPVLLDFVGGASMIICVRTSVRNTSVSSLIPREPPCRKRDDCCGFQVSSADRGCFYVAMSWGMPSASQPTQSPVQRHRSCADKFTLHLLSISASQNFQRRSQNLHSKEPPQQQPARAQR